MYLLKSLLDFFKQLAADDRLMGIGNTNSFVRVCLNLRLINRLGLTLNHISNVYLIRENKHHCVKVPQFCDAFADNKALFRIILTW